jgi:sRNA-binding carbon storage regulator CsrA
MLSLSRRIGQEIVIGDPEDPIGIIRVANIVGTDKASIALDFPKDIPINRKEVAQTKLLHEKKESSYSNENV